MPTATDRFLCLYASIDYVKGINLGSPRVPETVKWDGVGLIVYKRDATGRSGTTPIPRIVSLHRETIRSGNYWELLGSSGKQWETANPRYRIFAP